MAAITEILVTALSLHQRGRLDAAARLYQSVLAAESTNPDALHLLGVVFHQHGNHAAAIRSIRRAISVLPGNAAFFNNLGEAYLAYGDLDQAVASYERALERNPSSAETHNNLGNALMELGRFKEAEARYRQSLALCPDDAKTNGNLLFCKKHDPEAGPPEIFMAHYDWGCRFRHLTSDRLAFANTPDANRRLRIGYVSPDLRRHPVAQFMLPILRHHDAKSVEVYCYSDVICADPVTSSLRQMAHGWRRTCGLSDADLARLIKSDGVDILVDLTGHTGGNRLLTFARRPAPVQVTYLGYPDTTGLETVDYRLTDDVCDPPGESIRHTEQIVRVEGGFCCYAPPPESPDVVPLPAVTSGGVTFGSLHRPSRLNGHVLNAWCRILKAVPSSRLLLFRNSLRGQICRALSAFFGQRGLGPERVKILHASVSNDSHLSVYGQIDIALDTFPWSGHTTACEALWMGVPVVTLRGQMSAGRMVASVLTQLRLTEWIAETVDDYVYRATAMARDVQRIAELRLGLRDRISTSPLCDGQAFARKTERAYREMWRAWVAGSTNISRLTRTEILPMCSQSHYADASAHCRSPWAQCGAEPFAESHGERK